MYKSVKDVLTIEIARVNRKKLLYLLLTVSYFFIDLKNIAFSNVWY